ncbi:MAG: hypothetical protein A3K31_17000 [Ignavibacteria bacterium RIFOXYA12_FULL_35_25]|nr:MAG: hypothetical protein A2058_13750 [Ignavibacteria bacterium GWA2_36_19]OGU62830.1 MAG: hypothetical protein A2X60_04625 [Ignavibacteria bacterium GWF2_35_20]OGU86833.1 MAG: hypothetical protein A3K31_17000 [Ignavibacteria bacterium RIFOXYA12_FULL_35_25]OGV29955.1 MAG: hypothetical protein A2523_01000 [Ignavibacteria bacterium RIFOXYD12_FULL_36_8]
MKYFNIVFFFFCLNILTYSQTVRIDDISISIDDSLEQVISKFQKPGYHLISDTLKLSIRCTIFKEVYNSQDSNKPLQVIGYLHFFYVKQEPPFHYTKELYEIDKVWSNYYVNNVPDLLKIINNIFEKNTIDKYSVELIRSKNFEPDYSSKTLTIKLNSFTSLEIYSRDDNYFEINEVITKDENRFSDEKYILIFEDYKHYYGDKEYVIEYFKKEDEAERRQRELLIKYIMDSSDKPETKILRFYKNRSYTK